MSKVRLFRVIPTVLLLLAASCTIPRYYSAPGDETYLLADYDDSLKLWTAHDEINHRFIGVADLNCIYRSWELRQAYLSAIKSRMKPGDARLKHETEREINGFKRGNEFYLGLYTYEPEWNKLTGADPVWLVTLCSDTASPVKPILIEKIDIKPEESWLYLDDLTHGRTVYRVVFPLEDADGHRIIDENTREFQLRCNSLLGEMCCHWTLKSIPSSLR